MKPFNIKSPVLGIKKIIAVASGKGGVGKSTVAVNLAATLMKKGLKVGLLDADIYGPSIPMMMGISQKPEVNDAKKIIPLLAHNVKVMSMGFLVPEGSAAIWRGPMVQSAFLQLLFGVAWGDLDVLFIDLPPGTGDIQLTLSQQVQVDGVLIVSTPQDIALLDAKKAFHMFSKVQVPVLGMIENMSIFECPHCHHKTPIFSEQGVEKAAHALDLPFLGGIPLIPSIRKGSDEGVPAVLGDSSLLHHYEKIAAAIEKVLG